MVKLEPIDLDIVPRLADPDYAREWVAQTDARIAELEAALRHAVKIEDVLIRAHGALRGVVDVTDNLEAVAILHEMERVSARCAAVRQRNP